jgi:hypothetical protein
MRKRITLLTSLYLLAYWTAIPTGVKGSALEEYKILKTLDIERANKLFNFIYK